MFCGNTTPSSGYRSCTDCAGSGGTRTPPAKRAAPSDPGIPAGGATSADSRTVTDAMAVPPPYNGVVKDTFTTPPPRPFAVNTPPIGSTVPSVASGTDHVPDKGSVLPSDSTPVARNVTLAGIPGVTSRLGAAGSRVT